MQRSEMKKKPSETIADLLINAFQTINVIRDPYKKYRLMNRFNCFVKENRKDWRHTGKRFVYRFLFDDGSCIEWDQWNYVLRKTEW